MVASVCQMLTEMPVLVEITKETLLPPMSYQAWADRINANAVNHMLTSKTQTTLIGARLSGGDRSRGAFLKTWRKQMLLCTSRKMVKQGADILLDHGQCFASTSKKGDRRIPTPTTLSLGRSGPSEHKSGTKCIGSQQKFNWSGGRGNWNY